jgi:hypothetical protein
MSPPILQTTDGKYPYKYNTTQTTQYDMNPPILQTTQYDMSPPTLQTTGGKDPYKYNTTHTTRIFTISCL